MCVCTACMVNSLNMLIASPGSLWPLQREGKTRVCFPGQRALGHPCLYMVCCKEANLQAWSGLGTAHCPSQLFPESVHPFFQFHTANLFPSQDASNLSQQLKELTYRVDQNCILITSLCEEAVFHQHIQNSWVQSPSPCSPSWLPGQSERIIPGLTMATLALSDTHSNASSCSSGKLSEISGKSHVCIPCIILITTHSSG